MTDTRSPVPPIEGWFGRLRDGTIHGPIVSDFHPRDGIAYWVPNDLSVDPNGKGLEPRDDLIELISPEAMNDAVALSQQPSQEELSKGSVLSRFQWSDPYANLIAAAEAALAHFETTLPQPIESAPRDGNILAWDGRSQWPEWEIASWSSSLDRFTTYAASAVSDFELTHWRPLPPAPDAPPPAITALRDALEQLKGTEA